MDWYSGEGLIEPIVRILYDSHVLGTSIDLEPQKIKQLCYILARLKHLSQLSILSIQLVISLHIIMFPRFSKLAFFVHLQCQVFEQQ